LSTSHKPPVPTRLFSTHTVEHKVEVAAAVAAAAAAGYCCYWHKMKLTLIPLNKSSFHSIQDFFFSFLFGSLGHLLKPPLGLFGQPLPSPPLPSPPLPPSSLNKEKPDKKEKEVSGPDFFKP